MLCVCGVCTRSSDSSCPAEIEPRLIVTACDSAASIPPRSLWRLAGLDSNLNVQGYTYHNSLYYS